MILDNPASFSGATYVSALTDADRQYFWDLLRSALDYQISSIWTFFDSVFAVPGLWVAGSSVFLLLLFFLFLRSPFLFRTDKR